MRMESERETGSSPLSSPGWLAEGVMAISGSCSEELRYSFYLDSASIHARTHTHPSPPTVIWIWHQKSENAELRLKTQPWIHLLVLRSLKYGLSLQLCSITMPQTGKSYKTPNTAGQYMQPSDLAWLQVYTKSLARLFETLGLFLLTPI